MIEIKQINPSDAQELIHELDEYQRGLYPPESCHLDPMSTLQAENVKFYGAIEDEQIIGIGSVKLFKDYGELKRIYVPPKHRGRSLAKKIIAKLEATLLEHHIHIAKLETGPHSKDAIGLYQNIGYHVTSAFGDYPEDPLSTFMEKKL